jgi:Rrf2 family iron-sulfur cluster assembly transcriptional regulator
MTHELWAGLNRHMVDYLDSVSLASLVEQQSSTVRPVAVSPSNRPSAGRSPLDESAQVG